MNERYQRQTLLADFGPAAQAQLQCARVLVVGAGGLGTPVLQYLNAMGVGELGIVEDDTISLSNLHRQVLYHEHEVDQPKLKVAIARLQSQNSQTTLTPFATRLQSDNALDILANFDVVVDASDNLATRYLINDACVMLNKPFVYGGLYGFEGQVSVFNHQQHLTRPAPTYRCVFPYNDASFGTPDCNTRGVLGVLPGLIGSYQALEVVKVITGVGETLSGLLLLVDGLTMTHQKIRCTARPHCQDTSQLQAHYGPPPAPETAVGADQLDELLAHRAVVWDVRSPMEHDTFHLTGTQHIPLDTLEQHAPTLPATSTVYLLCASGQRSQRAVRILQQLRPDSTFISVSGGLQAYPSSIHER